MAHKLNLSEKSGMTWKLELDSEALTGRKLGDIVQGKDVSEDLLGYEFRITGATDFAGFPLKTEIEGTELRRVLLTDGWGMHKKPRKEGKKKVSTPNGLRLRKTIRGNVISDKTIQVNLKIEKPGSKSLVEIYPDQNKKEDSSSQGEAPQLSEKAQSKSESDSTAPKKQVQDNKMEETAEKVAEEIKEEVAEEIKADIPISPETKTEEQQTQAAEKIAEEVKEEVEEISEGIAEKEKSK